MIIKGKRVSGQSTFHQKKRSNTLNGGSSKSYHYPGLLPQPKDSVNIFDNSLIMNAQPLHPDGQMNGYTDIVALETDKAQILGNLNRSFQQNINNTNQTEFLPNDTTDQSQNPQASLRFPEITMIQHQQQQKLVNLPSIKLNSSTASIGGVSFTVTGKNQQIAGIGPGGIELTSFFSNTKGAYQVPPNYYSASNSNGPATATGIGNEILMQDFPAGALLGSQGQSNASANQTQNMEFSPDNTQYTILKAKLFNPVLKDEGSSINAKLMGSKGDSRSPGGVIHSQQYQIAQTNFQQQALLAKQRQGQPQRQIQQQSQQNAQIDLGKQIRHKKDMQQLKFYQTLTNQPNNPSGQSFVGSSSNQIMGQGSQQQQSSFMANAPISTKVTKSTKGGSQPPMSRGVPNRPVQKTAGNPYINIQSHYGLQESLGTQDKGLGTSGLQFGQARPQTTGVIQFKSQANGAKSPQNQLAQPTQEDMPIYSQAFKGIGQETFSVNNALAPHNEKSYTQLLSDNSRENYIQLKSSMNSKDQLDMKQMNGTVGTNKPERLESENTLDKSQDDGLVHIGGGRNVHSLQKRNNAMISTITNNNASMTVGEQHHIIKRRQMISIEKVEKKRILSDSLDYHLLQNNSSILMPQNPYDTSNTQHHNHSMIIDHNHNISQQVHSNTSQAKRGETAESVSYQQPVQNLIIKRCQMKGRELDQSQLAKQKQYGNKFYTLKRGVQDKLVRGNKESPEQLNKELFKAESQLIVRKSIHKEKQEKIEKLKSENYHKACHRFLERGNKPVPPNYEEQDVLPLSNGEEEDYKQKSKSKKQIHFQRNFQGGGLIGGGAVLGNKVNLDEFDEEINGINLGKLFSVYGPNSVENKRKSLSGIGLSKKESGRLKSGRRHSLGLEGAADGGTKSDGDQIYSDDEDIEKNTKQDSEPTIVIKLMASMFTKKKSVRERMMMIPAISLEKLRKELQQLKLQEKSEISKQQRENFLKERFTRCERLWQKLPNIHNRSFTDAHPDLLALEYDLAEKEKVKNNPFYLALKENKDYREKIIQLRKLKKAQMLQEEEDRTQFEEDLKQRAQEKVKTDIFAHTFVDLDDQAASEPQFDEQYKGDILNRPPKDVFVFMNLNFDLPITYYQSFGDFRAPTDIQKSIIKEYMSQHWPKLTSKKITYKIAFDHQKQVFNTIILGRNCPLSKCCKMTVCFQFDKEIHGGKVICMETLCPYNPLDQFFLDKAILNKLYLLDTDSQTGDTLLGDKIHYQTNQVQPRFQKAIASEISRSIQKGNFKNLSLRDLLQKQTLVSRTKTGGKKRDPVSLLYSLDDSSNYNILLGNEEHDDEYDEEQCKIIQEEQIFREEEEEPGFLNRQIYL